MAFTTPALAGTKTVNGISAEVNLPNAQRGVAYSATIAPTGGGGAPYTFAMTSGTLPSGFTLSSAGTLAGTNCSAANGSYPFSVLITSSTGTIADFTGTSQFSVQMTAGPAAACSLTLAALPTTGTVGTPYSGTASITGGTPPYTWTQTAGTLPPGLTLATGSGLVSGTPTTAGTYAFTLQVTDSAGAGGVSNYSITITIGSAITVNPATLSNGLQNIAYSQTVSGSGGTAPYTFAVSAGALPTGLSLSTTGTISGTPTVPGTYNFTVQATDANGFSGTRGYAVVVTAAPTIAVSPASMSDGLQNMPYDTQTIVASGGTSPYAYSISSGALPAGLSLSTGGVLSGTPTESGTFNFTITATDANGYSGSRAYALSVTAAPTIAVDPAALPDAIQSEAYSQSTTATGGTGPHTFAVTGGALPAGLTLATDGTLSGTPTESGTFNFTVTATDANGYTGSRAYALGVTPASTISVAPPTLPSAELALSYSQTITASGGTGPYAFGVTAGALPAGLTLSAGGALSGTPTESGTFNFTVTATDANGYTGSRAYALSVTAAPTITLGPASLPGALQNQSYASQTITAAGGTAPHTFAVTGGALPSGLSLAADGTLSGTPTASGTFNFTVTATDSDGYEGSLAYTLDVTAAPAITISPASLPAVSQNQPYFQTIAASGGTPDYTYAATGGALPAGLALASDGTLSGTPTVSGTSDFTVTAADANGYTASQAFTLTVNAPLQAVAADPVPSITAGGAITPFIPVTASGGTAPYTYSISPGLPAGMTFDPATGQIAGTPTQSQPLTTFTVMIQEASGETTTKTFDLEVLAYTVSFTPASADLGRAGLPVDLTLAGEGGYAPYEFTLESGVLPGGLSLSLAGELTGRTAQAGTYPMQLRVTDANGVTAVQAVTFTVGEPRPDPTLDAGVNALQTAQVDSIRRFGQAQTDNAVRRLEQLRGCSAPGNQLNVQVGNQGNVPVGQLAADANEADCEQARSGWVAGTVVLTDGMESGDSLTTDGVTVGMDLRVSDTFALGAGIGYSREGDSRLAGGAKLAGDGYNALAYGSWQLQPRLYVEGLVGYGTASYDISRLIAEEDVRATASRDASHWFGSLGIAANMTLANAFLQPYLRADYQAASFDAYRESSVSSLALRYAGLDSETMGYTGGVRANWSIERSFGSFDPMLRLEYRGENRSSLHQHLQYADGLDGIDYQLKSGSDDDTSGLVGAGFGLRFLNGFSAELEYQTTFGSDLRDEQSIGAIVNWTF